MPAEPANPQESQSSTGYQPIPLTRAYLILLHSFEDEFLAFCLWGCALWASWFALEGSPLRIVAVLTGAAAVTLWRIKKLAVYWRDPAIRLSLRRRGRSN
jgi:hypothetical protein